MLDFLRELPLIDIVGDGCNGHSEIDGGLLPCHRDFVTGFHIREDVRECLSDGDEVIQFHRSEQLSFGDSVLEEEVDVDAVEQSVDHDAVPG